ncbi:MAG: peptidylprolyl isomerase, partial [Actinomycetota bacterium]|nr:peptidylprolyl isomerase [Actinomycetota bacterium]
SALCLCLCLCLVAPAGAQAPAVAMVDGVGEVTRADYDHWARIARRIGSARRVRRQVMELLVQNLWVQGEAAQRGVTVTDEEVRRAFRRQKRQSFGTPRQFRRFLRRTGYTVRDLLYRVRLEQLSNRIRKSVVSGVPAPSEEELRTYYDEQLEGFTRPEHRHVWVLRTRTRAAAARAKRAIARGMSFPRAARVFGGRARRERLIEDVIDRRFARAVFRTDRGRLGGPVRALGDWHVFRVLRIVPARVQPYEEARPTILGLLEAQRQQEALDAFIEDFRERWRPATSCRERYATPECGRVTR